jgi:hypothetical protein
MKIKVVCPGCGLELEKRKDLAIKNSYCRKCSYKKLPPMSQEEKDKRLAKRKATCLERYGVDNPAKNKQVQDKWKQTKMELYGNTGAFQNKELQKLAEKNAHSKEAYQKREDTCYTNHGTSHHMKNKEIAKKPRESYKEKTGYDHPMRNPEVIAKIIARDGHLGHVSCYFYNERTFDSSWEIAYYIWLTDHNKQFVYHPNIPLKYIGDDGLDHNCYVDFLVEGKFYEIKGSQFFNEKNEPFNMYTQKYWWGKFQAFIENNVTILKEEDIKVYLKYVSDKYGKDYIKQFKFKNVNT